MFFAKNEVIELEDQKNYFVLNTAIVENEVFYQIQEVDDSGDNVIGDKTVIIAVNNRGNLYIEDVQDKNKLSKLNEIFAS